MHTRQSDSDPNAVSRRVCAQLEIGQRADWTRLALEQYEPNSRDRACYLLGHAGRVAELAVRDGEDLRTELIRVAGHALEWIEQIDRESAW